jgi:uncharacterized protein (DUF1499 family)
MISLKLILMLLILLFVIYLGSLSFLTRHNVLKQEGERVLAPCPTTPNCVSSLSSLDQSKIEAFKLSGPDRQKNWEQLVKAIEMAGGEILINDGRYCHAIFSSTFFRFKDDLEASLEESEIAIRSASRAGKSDLGQNRKRVEKIRTLYLQSL